jgi:hypothetical protein
VAPDGSDGEKITCAVFGHTHSPTQVTLDITPRGRRLYYVNTGTWRRTITPAALEKRSREFMPMRSMSYAAFFKDGEHAAGHCFETWNGTMASGLPVRRPDPAGP